MAQETRAATPETESLYTLQELEPSPVDETPINASIDSYFPDTKSASPPPAPSRTSTLGLGNHGPAYYLLRIQKYSSYAFTVFTAFHITNTSLIPLATRSVTASDKFLLLTRPYYQGIPFEPLLVALPLVAHVSSGIALRLYRRRQHLHRYGAETRTDKRSIPWPAVSGISALGFALTPMVAGHVFTTRILPMYLHGDNSIINLSYIAHGFALHPLTSFAGFAALVGVGVWHSTWGWAKWLGWTPSQVTQGGPEGRLRRKKRWYILNAIAAVVSGLWMTGGLGIVGRGGTTGGWIGREYEDLYNHMPLLSLKI